MHRFIFALLACLISTAAIGQVRQSGNVTQGHAACWTTSGVVQDCGTAAIPFATSLGTHGQGPTICASSDLAPNPYNQLCLGASTSGAAQISLQNYGGATAQPLQFNINGNVISLPVGGIGQFIFGIPPLTNTHIPYFDASGNLIDSGLAANGSGAITTGTWQGTPVAIGFGGTGATSATTARTNLGLGTIATQNSNNVAITGGNITGMPNPSLASDVANKQYVDAISTGLHIMSPVRLTTAAVLPNSPTYSNGASGVGATLTAGSNTTLTVDGSVANLNDRVLVKNQASALQNGVYSVTTAGGGVPWVLTRTTDFDQPSEMLAGSYFFTTAGSANINSAYVLQTTIVTVGSDAVNFTLFSSASAQVTSWNGATGAITFNSTASKTTNYTIQTTDCGTTVQAGTGSTGTFVVTLPAVGGFSTTCVITVVNGDTGRGKVLSGFPNSLIRLWPLQSVQVQVINGAWSIISDPKRWKLTGDITIYFDGVAGNNANDGLAAGAGNALQSFQHAYDLVVSDIDPAGHSITLQAAGGQTYTNAGLITSSNVISSSVISPTTVTFDGGGSTWTNSDSHGMIELGGNIAAQVQIKAQNFICTGNTNGSPCLVAVGATIIVGANVTFGTITGTGGYASHITAVTWPGQIYLLNNYTISGGATGAHWNAQTGGLIVANAVTATCTGNFNFTPFMAAQFTSQIYPSIVTWSGCGGTTGQRFNITENSILSAFGSPLSLTALPGNVAGGTSGGGLYAGTTQQWNTYTPTLSCSAGSLSSAAASGGYYAFGKTVVVRVKITIVSNGSCAGTLNFTLPTVPTQDQIFPGQVVVGSGVTMTAHVFANVNTVFAQRYDAGYPGADSSVLQFSGIYEQ